MLDECFARVILQTITHTIRALGRPRATPPPNRANKLPTQFTAPYTSYECKILDVYLNL